MSKTQIEAVTELWIEGDRISLGVSGKHIPGTQRLSTKLDTQTGKLLAAALKATQVERFASKLGSNGKYEVTLAKDGSGFRTLSQDHPRRNRGEMTRLEERDGALHAETYQNTLEAATRVVQQVALLRRDGDVDAWKDLPVKTTSRLARDLLTLTKDVDSFGWYPGGVKVGGAEVQLGTLDSPFIIVRLAEDLAQADFVEIMEALAPLKSQEGYPVVTVLKDGESTADWIFLNMPSTVRDRQTFSVYKSYQHDETKHHYVVKSWSEKAHAFFTQVHGTGEQRGQITQIALSVIVDAKNPTVNVTKIGGKSIASILNAVEMSEHRPSPVALALNGLPAPVIDEADTLRQILAQAFEQDIEMTELADFLVSMGYRKHA